jgi:oligoribonuclease
MPMQNAKNLIWVDMEMTGLEPDDDVVIEIATIVTDSDLNTLAEGPVIALHQSDERLAGMDEWNTTHHNSSGLVARVKASQHNEQSATQETIDFLQKWVPAGTHCRKNSMVSCVALCSLCALAFTRATRPELLW